MLRAERVKRVIKNLSESEFIKMLTLRFFKQGKIKKIVDAGENPVTCAICLDSFKNTNEMMR